MLRFMGSMALPHCPGLNPDRGMWKSSQWFGVSTLLSSATREIPHDTLYSPDGGLSKHFFGIYSWLNAAYFLYCKLRGQLNTMDLLCINSVIQ